MTKKTTILLTAFFAVSGMATCHAGHKFFTGKVLGKWSKRSDQDHVFNLLGIHQENPDGWLEDWSNETQTLFKDYKAEITRFMDDVNYLNVHAPSLLGSEPLDLKTDDTGNLPTIKNAALQIINALGNPPKADEINKLAETLANKIEEAKEKGIDVSSMNTGKQSTSAPEHHSAASHSSGGSRNKY